MKKRLFAMLLVVVLLVSSISFGAFAESEETQEPAVETTEPTVEPTVEPTAEPTVEPTAEPTAEPTVEPTAEPTAEPSVEPTVEASVEPTAEPTVEPTEEPTEEPTAEPTAEPTEEPSIEPTPESTAEPTAEASAEPTGEAQERAGIAATATSGSCGENVTWKYDSYFRTLYISGTGPMYQYDDPADLPWASYIHTMISAYFEAGVTSISSYAICNSFTTYVGIGTTVETIGKNAFANCPQLIRVSLPTGLTEIGANAFAGCATLASLTLPSGLTSLGANAFANCTGLTEITVPGLPAEIGNDPFSGCANAVLKVGISRADWQAALLENPTLAKDVKSVRFSLSAYQASPLEAQYVYTGSAITPGVTVSDGTNVLVADTDYEITGYENNVELGTATITVAGIGDFYGILTCTFAIKRTPVTEIRSENTALTLEVGQSVTPVIEILPSNAYQSVDWLKDDPAIVTVNSHGTITGVSVGTGRITARAGDGSGVMLDFSVTVVPVTTGTCGAHLNWSYDGETGALTIAGTGAMDSWASASATPWSAFAASISSVRVNVGATSVGAYAFSGCTALASVQLPAGLAAIGDHAFQGCVSLGEIDLPAGLSAIGAGTFSGCAGLTGIALPTGLSQVGVSAFGGCTGLAAIDLPASVTTVSAAAFDGCAALSSVRFGGTRAQWLALLSTGVGASNEALFSATTTYNLCLYTASAEQLSYVSTGSPFTPAVTVTDGTETLAEGTDYTITGYANNVAPGTATIYITGAGSFSGDLSCTLEIYAEFVTEMSFARTALVIDMGQSVRPALTILPLNAVNRAVTWTTSNAGVAKVDEDGKITGVKKGSCTVTATAQDGGGALATIAVNVVKKGKGVKKITLNKTSLTLFPSVRYKLKATFKPSRPTDKTVVWESSDETVATVANRTVTAVGYGSCVITATASSGLAARCEVTVAPRLGTLTAGRTSVAIGIKETFTLSYEATPYDPARTDVEADVVTYSSDNTRIATVTSAGVVKGKKAGTTTIRIRTASGLTASCKVKVYKAPTKVSVTAARKTVGVGEVIALKASFKKGESGGVSWSIPAEQQTIATIDEKTGVLEALATGTVTVTARTYNKKTGTIQIRVGAAPTYVELNFTDVTVCVGDKTTICYGLNGYGAVEITSSDPAVAQASVSGRVVTIKGVSEGSATIRVQAYNGVYEECAVTVAPAPAGVTLAMAYTTIAVGQRVQIVPTIAPCDTACTMKYKSSSTKYATVSSAGVVKGVRVGTATITVKTYNGRTAKIKVKVVKAAKKATLTARTKLGVGETAPFTVKATGGAGGVFTCTSNDPSVLLVNADGTVTALSAGIARLTAKSDIGISATLEITVGAAPTDESFAVYVEDSGCPDYEMTKTKEGNGTNRLTVARGDSTSLGVAYGAATYQSDDTNVVTVSADGETRFVGNGTANVTCRSYSGATRTVRFTVIDPPDKIYLWASPLSTYNYGVYLMALDADFATSVWDVYDILSYSVKSSKTSVLSAYKWNGNFGIYDMLVAKSKTGTSKLTVKLFNGASASVNVKVTKNKKVFWKKTPSYKLVTSGYFAFALKSVEIVSPTKVVVEFYVLNNTTVKIKTLVGFDLEIWCSIYDPEEGTDEYLLAEKHCSKLTVNVSKHSTKTIKVTITGSGVNQDLTRVLSLPNTSADDIGLDIDLDDIRY